jgi:MYXO-CTERM domain-containing protein
VDFTAYAGGPVVTGIMNLSAASVGAAAALLGQDGQRFSGSFCITATANCTGTNLISGTFTDAAFGSAGGTDLTVNVSDPSETLALTSSLIPASQLVTPNAFALSLVTGSAPLGILGAGATQTLGAVGGGPITYFTTGDVSASVVSEPQTFGLAALAMGMLGMTALRRRRRR